MKNFNPGSLKKKDYDLLKAQMIVSILKLKYAHYFFRYNAITLNRLQYSVNIISYALGNQKKIVWFTLLWYLLYYDGMELNPQYLQGMPVWK